FAGPYRVIDETIVWEFPSSDGSQAYHSKRQRVRFNYLVIAHIELASGDGVLFDSFECSYGDVIAPVHRADEEGLLIYLNPERRRDEEKEITSRRGIRDGFVGSDQWITHRSSVSSRSTELIVQFPDDCPVHDVRIAGPSGHGSRPARDTELRTEGAKQVLRLKPRPYRANQSIKITWGW